MEIEHERRVAMEDLVENADFMALSGLEAPYAVAIQVQENRLSLTLTNTLAQREVISLSLAALRGVIKDYFLMCESYYAAIPEAGAERIQTLDMARRAVHNEGAEQLMQLVQSKIRMDFATARRLFTLICVLHIK